MWILFLRLNHQFCSIRSIFILKQNFNRIALLFFALKMRLNVVNNLNYVIHSCDDTIKYNISSHLITTLKYNNVTKWNCDEMSLWRNVTVTECHCDEMSLWRNVTVTKFYVTKCHRLYINDPDLFQKPIDLNYFLKIGSRSQCQDIAFKLLNLFLLVIRFL